MTFPVEDEHILYVQEGYGTVYGICVRPGDCLRLGQGFGPVAIDGDMTLIIVK